MKPGPAARQSIRFSLGPDDRLIDDLRGQILPLDATLSRSTLFGETYFIDGPLLGPSGERIHVRTVWQRQPLSGTIHFVTLIPQPKSTA